MLTRGAEAVPRPGRGGSGGHPAWADRVGSGEEISGIPESMGGPADRLPWVECSCFSSCWFGVPGTGRKRSGAVSYPASSAFAENLRGDHRMLASDATPLAGRLLHKRKETAGLPRQWPKKEKTVCFLQSH